ncbi:MAG: helix-turn-helix transcriptional regulator [Chloroflexi bacterium]|nr:helix-turn-helix transcriptional regulator [Chloroflexota bacterium]
MTTSTHESHTGADGPAGPRLHGDLLTTSLLALLRGWNGYGYQLSQRLKACGLPVFDQGTVYRTLRQLEKTGLVASFWDTSASGPARRMYSLTQTGESFLSGWLEALERYQSFLHTLWGLPPPAAMSPATRDAAVPDDATPSDQ